MDQPHIPTPHEAILGIIAGLALGGSLVWGLVWLAEFVAGWWR